MSPEERGGKKEKNAIYSGNLRFCLQPKGSARTLLGPTEGVVSKLHYRLTALVFLVSCILVTSIEFVWNGMAISCIQDGC